MFLRTSLAVGTGAALATVGVFPPARKAFADLPGDEGYEIKELPCPGYAEHHNCDPGCGPSSVYSNSCVSDTSSPRYGWHRKDGTQWALRENGCHENTPDADGWLWHVSTGCYVCWRWITYRCHDGWNYNAPAGDQKSICRRSVGCGGD